MGDYSDLKPVDIDKPYSKELLAPTPHQLLKCAFCGWLHFVVEDGAGTDNCFFCQLQAKYMIPGKESDAPIGATLQGINMKNVRGKNEQ